MLPGVGLQASGFRRLASGVRFAARQKEVAERERSQQAVGTWQLAFGSRLSANCQVLNAMRRDLNGNALLRHIKHLQLLRGEVSEVSDVAARHVMCES